jgi:hypothetical protein
VNVNTNRSAGPPILFLSDAMTPSHGITHSAENKNAAADAAAM